MGYSIYLLQHNTGRTYIGITTDINRRVRQHNGELTGGAKATTRLGFGWVVKAILSTFDKSKALQLERLFKKKRGLQSRLNVFIDYQKNNSDIFLVIL